MLQRYISSKRDYKNLISQSTNEYDSCMIGGRIETTKVCKFEYLGKDPVEEEIIVSCSIFKLKSMYRDITIYVNGLRKIIEYICDPTTSLNMHMILYYDHSVEQDKQFLDLKQYLTANDNKVQLCKYHCSTFIDSTNDLHRGTFGTFIRFYPFFQKKYERNLKFIADIDFNEREILFYLKYIPENILGNDNNFVCIQKIGYEWKYANHFKNKYTLGTSLANIYVKNMSFPSEMLEDTLIQLRDNDSKLLNMMIQMQKDRLALGSDEQKFGSDINTFTYGIDEWFVNKQLVTYVVEKYGSVGIVYLSDNLSIYPKQMIDWRKFDRNEQTIFFKNLLGNRVTDNFGKNLHILSNGLSFFNITSIERYIRLKNNIRTFYEEVKKLLKDNKISLKDNEWMINLKKQVDTEYLFNFILFNDDKNTQEVYEYLSKNVEIKTVTKD
jgi:hypothetical protein